MAEQLITVREKDIMEGTFIGRMPDREAYVYTGRYASRLRAGLLVEKFPMWKPEEKQWQPIPTNPLDRAMLEALKYIGKARRAFFRK